MALLVRKLPVSLAFGLAKAFNLYVRAEVDNKTTYPHYDITSTYGGDYQTPSSTALSVVNSSTLTLTAVQTMAEEIRSVMLVHLADVIAHKASDSADLSDISYDTLAELVPGTSSQSDTNDLLNALKLAFNTHGASTVFHSHADSTNVIAAADATDLASSKVLAAAARTAVNAHILFAWPSPSLAIVEP